MEVKIWIFDIKESLVFVALSKIALEKQALCVKTSFYQTECTQKF